MGDANPVTYPLHRPRKQLACGKLMNQPAIGSPQKTWSSCEQIHLPGNRSVIRFRRFISGDDAMPPAQSLD